MTKQLLAERLHQGDVQAPLGGRLGLSASVVLSSLDLFEDQERLHVSSEGLPRREGGPP